MNHQKTIKNKNRFLFDEKYCLCLSVKQKYE